MNDQLESRVTREREAHSVANDVLGNSIKVKSVFWHTTASKTMTRMRKDFSDLMRSARGRKVLEIGCGHGELTLELLGHGAAFVAGIDISDKYIASATETVRSGGYAADRCKLAVMDAHRLEFEDDLFDLVAGSGILHHLDLDTCLGEISRVLKPGGKAVFIEPLAANPLLKLFRLLTPQARTADERPLSVADLKRITARWDSQSRYYGLIAAPTGVVTSLILRPFPNNPFLVLADGLERALNRIPLFRPLNQYVMLVLVKRGDFTGQ